ncbi:MAG TPA: hypothetical protein VFQ35_04355 [Polyangiaceae bacterium]|nr:hypothetical protein [Polyangiaceae bacterium]
MVIPTRLRVYGAFAAVFLLGAAAGASAAHAYVTRSLLGAEDAGELRDRRRLEALRRELGLDREQSDHIWTILSRRRPGHRALVRAAFERCGNELRDEREKLDTEIRKELKPSQQQRFDELVRTAHERFPLGREPR